MIVLEGLCPGARDLPGVGPLSRGVCCKTMGEKAGGTGPVPTGPLWVLRGLRVSRIFYDKCLVEGWDRGHG